jgi:serine/threonine-protein kinase HipA
MSTKTGKYLSVRLHGKEVGVLEEIRGKMRFQYSPFSKRPLSFSLPIQKEFFTHKHCQAYFGGLLPENQEIRKTLGRHYQINAHNDFALLAAIGHDCAGAVSFHGMDEPAAEELFIPLKGEVLSEKELEKHINELPIKPYLGRRLSLAGVQEKTPICVIDGKIALPIAGSPTTHILKPPLTRFKQSVANEYICLKTASAIGLTVPNVEIRKAESIEYFLIRRFDRLERNNQIMRLHHEDFAQALAVAADKKYDITFKDCLKVIGQTKNPALEKMKFMALAIFNCLIGNDDAHGKNYSILHLDNGSVLAPVYDVLCTNVYDLDHTMAMKIGKAKYISQVTLNDWKMFSAALAMKSALVLEELERQIDLVPKELEKIVRETNRDIGYDILNFVQKNCEKLQKSLK